MKKIIFLLCAIIVISNVIWSYICFKDSEKSSNTVFQIYNLSGTGNTWDIADYKIIVSPNKILRGNGKLAYKGDPKSIENSTYYKFEINEINPHGNYETMISNEASSQDGPVSILKNLDDIGSSTGEYSYDELKKDRENYESTVVKITWKDNEGKLHSETINLHMDSEIALD